MAITVVEGVIDSIDIVSLNGIGLTSQMVRKKSHLEHLYDINSFALIRHLTTFGEQKQVKVEQLNSYSSQVLRLHVFRNRKLSSRGHHILQSELQIQNKNRHLSHGHTYA
jgi:hypothetical protein